MTLDDIKALANHKDSGNIIELSTADLRQLAESNPSHPVAAVYLKSFSVKKRPDTYPLYIDRQDVLGILENKEVVSERVLVEGEDGVKVPTIQKKLGKTWKAPEPTAAEQ